MRSDCKCICNYQNKKYPCRKLKCTNAFAKNNNKRRNQKKKGIKPEIIIIETIKEPKIINTSKINIKSEKIRDIGCSICLENLPNVLFLPCQHMTICNDCKSVYNSKKCPICQKNIDQMIAVHHT
mgnify:FL=1